MSQVLRAAGRASGRLQSQHATAAQHTAGSQRQGDGISHQDQALPSAIISVANCLARRGTARRARHSATIGPKRGCASIQRSTRVEPREKQKAASSTKGVVGSSGRKIPTRPSARLTAPAPAQTRRCQVGRGGGMSLAMAALSMAAAAVCRPRFARMRGPLTAPSP